MSYNKETGLYEGYIYLITNDVNDKVYVGQTTKTVKYRFKQHLRETNRARNYPLYNTIRCYGKDKFHIDIIGVYVANSIDELLYILNEEEIKYIQLYNSITPFGFNLTLGGKNMAESFKTPIDQYTMSGEFVKSYSSGIEAAREVLFNDTRTRASIYSCCKGHAKSAYGYVWRYKGEPFDKYDIFHTVVDQYTKDGKLIATWDGYVKAAESLNKSYTCASGIQKCCEGTRKTAYGFVWRKHGESFDKYDIKYNRGRKEVPINQYDTNGNYLRTFKSVKEAAIFLGNENHKGNIVACCKKRQETSYGYKWSYAQTS